MPTLCHPWIPCHQVKPSKFLSESLLLTDPDSNQVKSVTNIAASKYQKTEKIDLKVTLRDREGIDKFREARSSGLK